MTLSLGVFDAPGILRQQYTALPTVAEYHFNELNGSTLIDSGPNKYHGTFGTTAPTRTVQGLTFSGTQWAELPLLMLGTRANWSVLAVFKTTSNNGQRILSASPNDRFNFYYYSSTLAFSVYPSGIEVVGTAVALNKWCCGVGVFRPGVSVDAYFNKAKIGSQSITENTFQTENSRVYCGKDAGGNFFLGSIATIIAYPLSLSDAQVTSETTRIMAQLAGRGIVLGQA